MAETRELGQLRDPSTNHIPVHRTGRAQSQHVTCDDPGRARRA